MADLSKMSDDEILALVNKPTGVKAMSDADLLKLVQPHISSGRAALIKTGEGIGLGSIAAGAGAAAGAFSGTPGGVGDKLSAAKDAFVQGRSDMNDELDAAQTQHPKISTAANVVGSLATVPFLPATKTLSSAIKTGASLGALQAANTAKNAGEAAVDVAGGGVAGAAGYGLSKLAQKASDTIKNLSETSAFKSAGAMLKDFRNVGAKSGGNLDKVNELGRTMLDNGLVKAGDTVEDIASKSDTLRKETGQQIGSIYNKVLDDLTTPENVSKISPEIRLHIETEGFHPEAQADDLKKLIFDKFKGKPGGSQATKTAFNVIDELAMNGNHITPEHALDLKSMVNDLVKYDSRQPGGGHSMTQEALKDVSSFINTKLQTQIGLLDEALGSNQTKELLQLNKLYGNLSDISSIAKDRVFREAAHKRFGLTDAIMGGAGATIGGFAGGEDHRGAGSVIGALATAGASHMGSRYGGALLTQGLEGLGNAIVNPNLYTAPAVQGVSAMKRRLNK